ncbi:hypothetical protein [Sphingobacterium siyangense]|jgi:hypothetical protein|uniref:hypothetical protein n=1 Tax=Sphingobacterium siyangense TaxID=459529 RepID=UPI003C76DC17
MLNDIIGFLKFQGEEKYLDLLRTGEIFCNTKDYFSNLKCEDLIGDDYENIVYFDYGESVKIPINLELDHITMKRQSNGLYYSFGNKNKEFINFFCLYAIRIKDCSIEENKLVFKVPKELKTDAENFLFISYTDKFILNIIKELRSRNLKYNLSIVKYQDFEKNHGYKSYFHKRKMYSVQNEFRFVIYNDVDEPLKFNIGDISDISLKIPMECETIDINVSDLDYVLSVRDFKWEIEK